MTLDINTLQLQTLLTHVFLCDNQSDITQSCFDQQEYLYLINKSQFVQLSIHTKQIKQLHDRPRNRDYHDLIYDQHRKRIYSISGPKAHYYSIVENKWHKLSTPPKEIVRCEVYLKEHGAHFYQELGNAYSSIRVSERKKEKKKNDALLTKTTSTPFYHEMGE
eukprot:gene13070-15372_t